MLLDSINKYLIFGGNSNKLYFYNLIENKFYD